MVMRQKSFKGLSPAGFHDVAYTEWGDPTAAQTIICCHGLTRNGRDFDALAMQLAKHARVICPDIVGRGKSDWLRDPAHYAYPQYCADMNALIARLDVPGQLLDGQASVISLKNVLAMLGLPDGAAQARSLERAALDGDAALTASLWAALRERLQALRA